jgi:hypothetical protein
MTPTQELRALALPRGVAHNGAISCHHVLVRAPSKRRFAPTVWRDRFMSKLNGHVISEARAAQWLNPDNANF